MAMTRHAPPGASRPTTPGGAPPLPARCSRNTSRSPTKRGIEAVGDKYNLDGSQVGTFHTPVTVGAFANATIASDGATADKFYQSLKVLTVDEYFPATLKVLYMSLGGRDVS